jgi:hypothetical protein
MSFTKFVTAAAFTLSLGSFAFAEDTGVKLSFKLSPVGSFDATSPAVKGKLVSKGGKITGQNLSLPLKSLTTGMQLRDTHMRDKYLEVGKYPEAVLVSAEGSGGKGKGTLKIRGVTKEVQGTYKMLSPTQIKAEFPFKLSDFKVTGVKHLGVGVKDEAIATVIAPVEAK